MIYVYCTVISVLMTFIAQKIYSKDVLVGNEKSQLLLIKSVYGLLVICSFLILFTLSGFRYYVGTDYVSYAGRLVNQVILGLYTKGILFEQIIKLSLMLGSSQWIFIISSLIIVGFTYKAIMDQSINVSFSVFLFVACTFFNFSLNAVRQAMATALFLYSIKFIIQKKPIHYILLILIAAGFHQIALLYLPFYFLNRLTIKKTETLIAISGLSIFLFVFKGYVREILYVFVNKFTGYGWYFGGVFDSAVMRLNEEFLIVNFFVLALIIFYTIEYVIPSKMQVYIWIQIIATLFSAVSFVIPAAFRIIYLFIPVQIILLPNLSELIKNKIVKSGIVCLVLIGYSLLFSMIILHANYNQTLPYSFNVEFLKSFNLF